MIVIPFGTNNETYLYPRALRILCEPPASRRLILLRSVTVCVNLLAPGNSNLAREQPMVLMCYRPRIVCCTKLLSRVVLSVVNIFFFFSFFSSRIPYEHIGSNVYETTKITKCHCTLIVSALFTSLKTWTLLWMTLCLLSVADFFWTDDFLGFCTTSPTMALCYYCCIIIQVTYYMLLI